MTVQLAVESVSSLPWNHCPASRGISVQVGVEYAPNALVKWIEAHPDTLKQPAGAVLEKALSEAFPCKGN